MLKDWGEESDVSLNLKGLAIASVDKEHVVARFAWILRMPARRTGTGRLRLQPRLQLERRRVVLIPAHAAVATIVALVGHSGTCHPLGHWVLCHQLSAVCQYSSAHVRLLCPLVLHVRFFCPRLFYRLFYCATREAINCAARRPAVAARL